MIDKIKCAWTFTRIGGSAGLGFALVIVGANLILEPTGMPPVGADVADVDAFFTDKAGLVGLSSMFLPAAWACVVVFGAAVVATLWPRERSLGSAWSLVGFAGLLLQNSTFVGIAATRLALSDSTGGAAGLWAMHNALFSLNGTFLAVAMLGFSLGGWRTDLIRRWHAVLGLTAATGQFAWATLGPLVIDHVSPLSLLGLVSWLLWVVWIATYGITLVRLPAPLRPVVLDG
ncbi:hypothetical protein OHB12_33965 [Nocardia sp. NBC_01730]|uniref:hypothetical protein n=1 Tax=Nocardia sp. NBC_01730 TaxID=2975998 RepID=UPI002E13681A|nr:hypothetical protein OHB12_33965 [Nocardia sp. NBC_01730]